MPIRGRMPIALFAFMLLAGSGLARPAAAGPDSAGSGPEITGPFFTGPFFAGVANVDLRDLPRAKVTRVGREVPLGVTSTPSAKPAPSGTGTPDPLWNGRVGTSLRGTTANDATGSQVARAGTAPTASSGAEDQAGQAGTTPAEFSNAVPNFDGTSGTGSIPPDTNGDIGPNHYVETVNGAVEIFDRTGVSLIPGPVTMSSIFAAANSSGSGHTGACATRDDGDPIANYDHLADRWLISQFAFPNPPNNTGSTGRFECVAISKGPNPVSDGWFTYAFSIPDGSGLFDYPKIGVWPDAYYMTTQQGFSGGGLDVWAMDRANMLNGNPSGLQRFSVGSPAVVLLPGDLEGPAPAAGTPELVARMMDGAQWGGTDRVEIYKFHVDWGIPAMSTFAIAQSINVAAFDADLCNDGSLGQTCIDQPGTTNELDGSSEWPMWRLQYRNFGTHETLVFDHTVDADGFQHAGIRWYELRRTPAGDVNPFAIQQQGTFAPDGGAAGLADDPHRWLGSIAMDSAGNMALGYSASGSTANVFPDVRYAGRLDSDPPGSLPHGEFSLSNNTTTFQPAATCTSGPCGNRWGDYSAIQVDPVDGCTFWYINEYPGSSTNAFAWKTRIGAFRFPSCNPTDLQISKTDAPDPVLAGNDLAYTLTVKNNGPANATQVVATDDLPSDVDYINDTGGCTEGPTRHLTCPIGNLANGAVKVITINVAVHSNTDVANASGAGGPKTISNTASVDGNEEDPQASNNTATATTTVNESADLKVTKECNPGEPTPTTQNVDCTVFIDNIGPSDARHVSMNDKIFSSGTFVVTNIVPSAGVTCGAVTPITGGQEFTCTDNVLEAASPSTSGRDTVSYRVSAPPGATGQEVHNVAKVTSDTPDPDESNNTAATSFGFESVSDLNITKSASPDPAVNAGEQLTYHIHIQNTGPSPAVNVVVTDNVPAGVIINSVTTTPGPPAATCEAGTPGDPDHPTVCNFGTLANGASADMEILTTVKPQTQGILHNDARVSADTPDTDNGDNLAHTDTTVTQKADLTLTKTDSPDPVVAGTPLDYTMVVTNNGGPSTARNVTLIDDLPVEVTYKSNTISGGTGVCDKVENTVNQLKCDLNDLDPNQQITVILHTVVNSSAPDGGITNNAHATTSATDLGGAQASASTLVKTVSDLLIVKTSDADEYKPSALIKYTITVTDIGPSDARNVKVVDDLPPVKDAPYTSDSGNGICSLSGNKAVLTCNFGYIVAGTSKSINVYCRVKGNKGQLTNKATVSLPAPTVDPVSGNDVSTRIVTIKGKNP